MKLLEALQAIVDAYDSDGEHNRKVWTAIDRIGRAAIAKATGGQQ